MTARAKWPRKAEKEEYWKDHVARCMQSGCSQSEYCQQQGLNKNTFAYWKKRLSKPEPESGFIPVSIRWEEEEGYGGKTAALHLQVGHRYRIEVGDGFNPVTLERLVKTLERSL